MEQSSRKDEIGAAIEKRRNQAREKVVQIVKQLQGGQQMFAKPDVIVLLNECEFLMNVCIHQAKVIQELEGETGKTADRQGGTGPDSTDSQDGVEGDLGGGSGGSEEHAGTGPDSTVPSGTPDSDHSGVSPDASSGILITDKEG